MFGHQDDHNNDEHHDGNVASGPMHDDTLGTDDHQQDAAMPAPAQDGQPADDTPNPALPTDHSAFAPSNDAPTSAPSVDTEGTGTNDLLDIKTQALQQLTPLVGHLDQSPEEKFRTTMMMIQASDDQSLVNVAYEAAKAITDEKAKAQALLDIVNEINYFTHQGDKEA